MVSTVMGKIIHCFILISDSEPPFIAPVHILGQKEILQRIIKNLKNPEKYE